MSERVDRVNEIAAEMEEIVNIGDHLYKARRQLECLYEKMETAEVAAEVEDEERLQVAHMIVTLGSLEHKWLALLREKEVEARRA